ncbi:MAG: hypothetical protein NTW15_02250 [Burkholderiales bacterium]|nr:hypothetical protein [Burkholderiales bacterium]
MKAAWVARARLARGACVAVLACTASAALATGPEQELEALRARIAEQRARLDAQERELREQRARLDEQARQLEALAGRAGTVAAPAAAGAPAPAAGEPGRAAAPPEPEPVRSRFDGMKVTLGGALRTTVTTTTARMQPDATPFLVLPSLPGVRDGTTKIDARLSSLYIGVEGAQLGEFRLGGAIYGYLFDGNVFSGQYGFYPGFAYVDATSRDTRFAAGLQMDVFSPRIPTMVDRMSAFAGSGNPGNSFKPQLRAERLVAWGADQLTLQAAVADALPSNIKPPTLASTENTGVPNLEGRVAYTSGAPRGEGSWVPWPKWELGLSGVTGEFRTFSTGGAFVPYETRLSGVALEGGLRIGRQFGLQGELYQGRALGPYLGAIFQTVGTTRRAIGSRGGWGELAWWWTPTLHSHAGYGIDRADAADLAGSGIASNRTLFSNLFWDPSPKTTLAIEGTWRRTVYANGLDADGFALMLSSELRF